MTKRNDEGNKGFSAKIKIASNADQIELLETRQEDVLQTLQNQSLFTIDDLRAIANMFTTIADNADDLPVEKRCNLETAPIRKQLLDAQAKVTRLMQRLETIDAHQARLAPIAAQLAKLNA